MGKKPAFEKSNYFWVLPTMLPAPLQFVFRNQPFKMSEKLCLQWNDFQENIKGAFGNLREDKDFKDVTLVCEDGQQVEAHKVVLVSSSPIFQKLLERNKHPHPLIYMRGLKFNDLLAIMDFLYLGAANIVQENLASFLTIAEELQLRGLMGNADQGDEGVDKKRSPPQDLPSLNGDLKLPKAPFKRKTSENSSVKTIKAVDDTALAIPSHYSGDDKVNSMMETLPKAQLTRGLSSSCQSNFLKSYQKFKHKS